MIPGQNIFRIASSAIGLQSVVWKKYTGRTISDVGIETATYDAGTTIQASVQLVSRSVYEQFGLDLQRNYVMVYTASDMGDLERGISPDIITWGGSTYQIESNQSDWYMVDGWNGYLAVKID